MIPCYNAQSGNTAMVSDAIANQTCAAAFRRMAETLRPQHASPTLSTFPGLCAATTLCLLTERGGVWRSCFPNPRRVSSANPRSGLSSSGTGAFANTHPRPSYPHRRLISGRSTTDEYATHPHPLHHMDRGTPAMVPIGGPHLQPG